MKERDKQREESKAEYMRDKQLVDNIVNKLIQEDLNMINETKKKKEIAKSYMLAAYEEKERQIAFQKEEERQEKERVRKYFAAELEMARDYLNYQLSCQFRCN